MNFQVKDHQNRLNLAQELGATHIINNKENNAIDFISNILGKENIDVFIGKARAMIK